MKPERRRDSFQDFEAKTIDAWDDGDDDLLKMASSKKQQTSNQRRGGTASGSSLTSNSLDNNCSNLDSMELAKNRSLQALQHISSTSGRFIVYGQVIEEDDSSYYHSLASMIVA